MKLRDLLALSAALFLFPVPASAQSRSGPVFARYHRPLGSATLDLATGTLTRGPRTADRAPTTTVDFANNDLSGFVGLDTGNGFCEWFDAGVKGFAGNASDLMNSITFAYCSSKLTPGSGGPGGTVKLGFYEGYTMGGTTPSTAVAVWTLAGLPGNTSSSSFFGGFRCYFLRVAFQPLVSFADGPIGYSWGFLDGGTAVVHPLGGVLAGTWPFLSCVASCSGGIGTVDGQGMTNGIDEYCPPGTLRSIYTFASISGSFSSISMAIEEVTDKPASVLALNSGTFPSPDTLASDTAALGQPWTATLTLGPGRTRDSSWILFFGHTSIAPNGVPIPQLFNGLNFGAAKAGRMLLCALNTEGLSLTTPHGGLAGSSSTSAPIAIPRALGLVCNDWCAQAVVLGPLSAADGGGNARLSSAVTGTIGSIP